MLLCAPWSSGGRPGAGLTKNDLGLRPAFYFLAFRLLGKGPHTPWILGLLCWGSPPPTPAIPEREGHVGQQGVSAAWCGGRPRGPPRSWEAGSLTEGTGALVGVLCSQAQALTRENGVVWSSACAPEEVSSCPSWCSGTRALGHVFRPAASPGVLRAAGGRLPLPDPLWGSPVLTWPPSSLLAPRVGSS